MHTGIEKGVEAGIQAYFMAYPIITDEHINEAIKLEYWIPKVRELLPVGEYETEIADNHFIGYIDILTPVTMFHDSEVPGLYNLFDFKYASNSRRYKESRQVHLYKYFFEKNNPGKVIKTLNYLIIPKIGIKQKKTESLEEFRRRIEYELSKAEIETITVEYDPEKIIDWLLLVKEMQEEEEFLKKPSYLCNWCEYQEYCQKGFDYMLLPKNERRNLEQIQKKVMWLYGTPFSGKTTFANKFPDPLMINTDGNIKFVDAPFISVKDTVEVTGRITKRTLAWDNLKSIIEELERKENDFKTIIVDLLEDCYEHCRLYIYDQMGITHESDESFKAWDKVMNEFLNTLKRLMNLDYENIILISHEDTTKDIMKKSGDKITAIKPNIREKVANKVAGMVDIVARVVADDQIRILSFKTNEVIFGGGRLTVSTNEIPLDYAAFLEVYEEANKNAAAQLKGEAPVTPAEKKKSKQGQEEAAIPADEAADAADAADAEPAVQDEGGEEATAPVPARSRKKRGE